MSAKSVAESEFAAQLAGAPAAEHDVLVRVGAGQIAIVAAAGKLVRELHSDDVNEVRREGNQVSIEIVGSAAILLLSDRAEALDAALVEACCTLPEFTRAMHSLGSSRAKTNAVAQREFLSPLLEARRRAEESVGRATIVAAFDADKLRRAVASYVATLTQRSADERPAARRAFAAAAEDAVESTVKALETVGQLAPAAAAPPADARVASWQRWRRALQGLFTEADRSWIRLESGSLPGGRLGS